MSADISGSLSQTLRGHDKAYQSTHDSEYPLVCGADPKTGYSCETYGGATAVGVSSTQTDAAPGIFDSYFVGTLGACTFESGM